MGLGLWEYAGIKVHRKYRGRSEVDIGVKLVRIDGRRRVSHLVALALSVPVGREMSSYRKWMLCKLYAEVL
jgi:hypothetical protein